MSEDGGFDDVDESFCAFASSRSSLSESRLQLGVLGTEPGVLGFKFRNLGVPTDGLPPLFLGRPLLHTEGVVPITP